MARASELEWLSWFFCNADFGPADSDVRLILEQRFKEETGKNLPEGYSQEEDGDTWTEDSALEFIVVQMEHNAKFKAAVDAWANDFEKRRREEGIDLLKDDRHPTEALTALLREDGWEYDEWDERDIKTAEDLSSFDINIFLNEEVDLKEVGSLAYTYIYETTFYWLQENWRLEIWVTEDYTEILAAGIYED